MTDFATPELVETAKALSDTGRVRILCALKGRELCVCQVVELLQLATSTVSKHMSILRQAGLVESRKDGRWVYYRRTDRTAAAPVKTALRWLDQAAAGDPDIKADAVNLERILTTPLEKLCQL